MENFSIIPDRRRFVKVYEGFTKEEIKFPVDMSGGEIISCPKVVAYAGEARHNTPHK
jgi:hypothetical protein